MEYKSVAKYLNKKNGNKKEQGHSFIYSFFTRIAICIIILLGSLVFLKYDKNQFNYMYRMAKWFMSQAKEVAPMIDSFLVYIKNRCFFLFRVLV